MDPIPNTTLRIGDGVSNTPSTVHVDEATLEFNRILNIVVPVLCGAIALVGLIGHTCVLVVSCKFSRGKLLNVAMVRLLSIADLVFLVLNVPTLALEYVMPQYPFPAFWCKTSQYIVHASACFTIYTLCLMSFDRFCAIVFPLKANSVRKMKNMYLGCIIIVIVSCLVNIPALYLFDRLTVKINGNDHIICTGTDDNIGRLLVMLFGCLAYLLPLFVLGIMYTGIFMKLIKREQNSVRRFNRSTGANYRAAKIVLILELGFFICWTPILLLAVLLLFTNVFTDHNRLTNNAKSALFVASNVFCYANSCLNPILYTFVSPESRRQCMSLFTCTRSSPDRRIYVIRN